MAVAAPFIPSSLPAQEVSAFRGRLTPFIDRIVSPVAMPAVNIADRDIANPNAQLATDGQANFIFF